MWLPVATFRRSLDDDARVTSFLANGVDRYRDHQGHRHQDDQHPDHQGRHQDDRHRDHQDRVCQGQMDALVHQYLLDRDQVHLQEYVQCEHQHQDRQDGHPLVDDQRRAHHLGDWEVAELDDRYLEEAE